MALATMDAATLAEWNLDRNKFHQFKFSTSVSAYSNYEWIRENFLTADYKIESISHISDICKSKSKEEIIKVCSGVSDPGKRTVQYLEAIFKSSTNERNAINEHLNELTKTSLAAINELFKIDNNSQHFKAEQDKSWIEDVKISRIMNGTDNEPIK